MKSHPERKANTEKKVNKLFKVLWNVWSYYELNTRYRNYTGRAKGIVPVLIEQEQFWFHQDLNRNIATNHAKFVKCNLVIKKGRWDRVGKEFYLKHNDPRRVFKEDLEDLKYE